MKLNFIHLCDHAFQSEGGKLNIIGVFKNINVKKFPGGVPKFNLVGSLEVTTDISGEFTLRVVLLGPNGNQIDIKVPQLKGILPKQKGGSSFDLNFNLEFGGLQFNEPGKYNFIVYFNEKDVGNISFDVLQYSRESN